MIAKGKLAAVIGGAGLLAGCVQPAPYRPPLPVYDYPAPYAAQPAPFAYAPSRRAARPSPAPPAPQPENPPLRELTPEESGAGSSWFSGLAAPSTSDCVGWWRLCHLY